MRSCFQHQEIQYLQFSGYVLRRPFNFLCLLFWKQFIVVGYHMAMYMAFSSSSCQYLSFLLLQPTIDEKYMLKFRSRCPRVKLNETEVMSSFPLDSYVCKKYSLNEVEVVQEETLNSELPELSLAEKFKLAYDEREKNSAPKRAKNQRRRLRLEQYFEGESVNKIQHLAENFMHRMKV